MKFQRMLCNGNWIDDDRIDLFCDMVLEREPWVSKNEDREPMTTKQQILDFLATGKNIRYDSDWYANIRDADAIVKKVVKPVEMVMCYCGHETPRNLRMSTSLGTSCPDCYDRMSD